MKTLIKQTRVGSRITRKNLADGSSNQVGFRMAPVGEFDGEKYVARVSVDVDVQTSIEVLMDFDTVQKLYNSMLQVQG